ncbi:hypothetical protein [Dongia sp.]|uniref:hypothetical protein n=1 Tax=Dongia sp. TaxID=1977262 RepID=UPI0035B27443
MNSSYHRGWQLPLIAFSILVLGTGGAIRPAEAVDDEVECSSIRLQLTGDGYDTICSADNGANVSYETLEANATDGTHFLVVNDARTNFRYIFESRSLRQTLTDIYSELSVSNWHNGKGEQGLTTAEFDADFKTVPSACVGFQKYTTRDQWGGWRRHVIGFGCSRDGDRAKVYDALKRIKFPQ